MPLPYPRGYFQIVTDRSRHDDKIARLNRIVRSLSQACTDARNAYKHAVWAGDPADHLREDLIKAALKWERHNDVLVAEITDRIRAGEAIEALVRGYRLRDRR